MNSQLPSELSSYLHSIFWIFSDLEELSRAASIPAAEFISGYLALKCQHISSISFLSITTSGQLSLFLQCKKSRWSNIFLRTLAKIIKLSTWKIAVLSLTFSCSKMSMSFLYLFCPKIKKVCLLISHLLKNIYLWCFYFIFTTLSLEVSFVTTSPISSV